MSKKDKTNQKVIQEILDMLSNMPEPEKINQLNLNYQNLKTKLEELESNVTMLYKAIRDIHDILTMNEKSILHEINQIKQEQENLKEKSSIINHLVSKISMLDDMIQEKVIHNTQQELIQIKTTLNKLNNQLETKVEEKISEFFENYQSKVDEAQTVKLLEVEQKLIEIGKKLGEIENKFQRIETIDSIKNEIDFEQTKRIVELQSTIYQIFNQSKNYRPSQLLDYQVDIEITENLPYNLDDLLSVMETYKAKELIIKSSAKPIIRSPNQNLLVGKVYLKNGDVLNFIHSLLTDQEAEVFNNQGYLRKIRKINQNIYTVTCQRNLYDYLLKIDKINIVDRDISDLPIIDINTLISNLSNLVVLLGISRFKNEILSILIDHINKATVRRIAVIDRKFEFIYKQQKSIIDQYEHFDNEQIIEELVNRSYDYDLVVINASNLSKNLIKMISRNSFNTVFLLSLDYDNIISFYQEYNDEFLLKTLKIYIEHKLLDDQIPIIQIVFVDENIRRLISNGDLKKLVEYIDSTENTETQTYNESIGYLVKTEKIPKEQAIRYLSSKDIVPKLKIEEMEIDTQRE
ncbi:MAG: hypothetical protein ABDH21_05170 [bacterium]